MKGSAIRSVPSWACVAAFLLLGRPVPLLAGDSAEIPAGTWVRVTTGVEVAGEGFAMGSRETRGRSLSDDKRTTTFDVNGQPVRVGKPGTTLEGAVQALDEKTLLLRGLGESPSIVIPRDAIAGLDVRRRESKKGLGLLIGAVAGGAIGYAATRGDHCRSAKDGLEPILCGVGEGFVKLAGPILGVVGGAIVGLIVAPGGKWEKNVPLNHVNVSFGLSRGRGIGVSVSLAF